jgi:hypothetical protein
VPDGAPASDSGDPMNPADRANVNAQRAAAADASQREADRQQQLALLASQQDFAARRDVFDAQNRANLQANEIGARQQTEAATLSQRDAEGQRTAEETYRNWLLHAADAAGNYDLRQQDQAQRAYEFEANRQPSDRDVFHADQSRESELLNLAQRRDEFMLNRQPSDRDRFEAQNRNDLQQGQQVFAAQEMQARYKMQAELNKTELSQREASQLNELKNKKSAVMDAYQKGQIDADTAHDIVLHLNTGIDPLQDRFTRGQIMRQQAEVQQLRQHTAVQAQIEQERAAFDAKSFPERIGTWTDENGMRWNGYQETPGRYKILGDPYAAADKLQGAAARQQSTLTQRNADHALGFTQRYIRENTNAETGQAPSVEDALKVYDATMQQLRPGGGGGGSGGVGGGAAPGNPQPNGAAPQAGQVQQRNGFMVGKDQDGQTVVVNPQTGERVPYHPPTGRIIDQRTGALGPVVVPPQSQDGDQQPTPNAGPPAAATQPRMPMPGGPQAPSAPSPAQKFAALATDLDARGQRGDNGATLATASAEIVSKLLSQYKSIQDMPAKDRQTFLMHAEMLAPYVPGLAEEISKATGGRGAWMKFGPPKDYNPETTGGRGGRQ